MTEPLSEREIDELRELIESDKRARWAWTLFRRVMAWTAAAVATIWTIMQIVVLGQKPH